MDNFLKAILNFNQQLAPDSSKRFNLNRLAGLKPDAVIIVGMGGSGQIGDLIGNLASELNIPVPALVWKDYGLPKTTFKNPLYVFVSFSGNTEETLSGFQQLIRGAKAAKRNFAAVCSGGELQSLAETAKAPLALFCGDGLAPRQAAGYMFYGVMGILKAVFPKIRLAEFTGLNPKSMEKTGREISRRLTNRTILIYTTTNNAHLAYNWKTRLNETAKSLAFSGTVPEIGHNEIVPAEKRGRSLVALFLVDPEDNFRNQKKIKLISELIEKYGAKTVKVSLTGKSRLEKTWRNLILADWASYHLAKLNQVSPSETKLIDQLKKLAK